MSQGLPEKSVRFMISLYTKCGADVYRHLHMFGYVIYSKRYRKGYGIKAAPKGLQNAIEPVITFVRDEVAKPNLGHKYAKYLPYLLTVFFFILINNIVGLFRALRMLPAISPLPRVG